MISKHKIKILRSLNTKKGRLSHKMILLEGKRLIEEVLSEKSKIKKIWITKDFENNNSELTKKINFEEISNKEIKMITGTVNPQGIIAITEIKEGSLTALEFKLTLSAPALSNSFIPFHELIPPPTVKGIFTDSAVL